MVWAWRLAAVFLPISLGWAAGDVSLVAHVQSSLGEKEEGGKEDNCLEEDSTRDVSSGKNAAVKRQEEAQAREVRQEDISDLGAMMASKSTNPPCLLA